MQVTGFLYFLSFINYNPCSTPDAMLVLPMVLKDWIFVFIVFLLSGKFLVQGSTMDPTWENYAIANLSSGLSIFWIYLNDYWTNLSFSPCIDPLTSTTHTISIGALFAFSKPFFVSI